MFIFRRWPRRVPSWTSGSARTPGPRKRPTVRPSARSSGWIPGSIGSCPATRGSSGSPRASTGPRGRSGTRTHESPAVLRRPDEHGVPVAGRQGGQRLPQAERIHRHRTARRGTGLERVVDGPPGPVGPLPARRPPRGPAGAGRHVHDPGRQVHGQAVQQPERRRLQVERRPLLHRPALRPAGLERGPGQGADFNGVYRISAADGDGDPADQGDDLPQRHRLLTRREDALRGQLGPARRRSGWRSRSRTMGRSAPDGFSPTSRADVGRRGKGCRTA